MQRVLVIGATGNIGREVVSELPATGVKVRALVRNPETARLPPHVEVARGDLTEPASLDQALHEVDQVFLLWFAPPAAVPAALDRIVRRSERIVFLSSPYKTRHPLFQGGQPNPVTPVHAEIERLIESSGRTWTFLRPGMLASNARMWWASQIRAGVDLIRWPYSSAPTAPTHERDIAAVAVRALLQDGHSRAEYVLTGPESLTQAEQLATLGRAISRPLRMENIGPDEARIELLPVIPALAIDMLLRAWSAAAGQPALVTSTVEELTGAPARSFRIWAEEHAQEFAHAR